MRIEGFEENFLEEIEGIHSSSFSFNRGSPQDFLYGRRYDFSQEGGCSSTQEVPHILFLHDIGEHGSRYQ